MTSTTRYKNLKRYPGVRKDLKSSKYLVEVSLNKKRQSKTFDDLDEALRWRNSFNKYDAIEILEPSSEAYRFKDLWEQYKIEHIPTLQKSSQENRLMMAKFFDGFWDYKLTEITPGLISKHLIAKKDQALKIGSARRLNFNHELKLMKAMFNWYHDEVDHTFANPVTRKHRQLGVIRIESPREKKLNTFELKAFLEALKARPFWYDFALTQLLVAGRVQEIAGLQKQNVDFRQKRIIIKDVAVWSKTTKRFDHLKPVPKNGQIREIYLSDELLRILKNRIDEDRSNSRFVFHDSGEPLSYRQIQYNYDWALGQSGLSDRFSGTHILRHSMATLTRKVTGSLTSAQAITGHKDLKLAQHYAGVPEDENMKAIVAVEKYLNEESFFQ